MWLASTPPGRLTVCTPPRCICTPYPSSLSSSANDPFSWKQYPPASRVIIRFTTSSGSSGPPGVSWYWMDSYGTWSTNASCSRVNASSRGGPSYSPIPIRCRNAVVSMRLRLGEVIDVLDRTAALAIAPELGEVFAAAFGAPGYDEEPDP